MACQSKSLTRPLQLVCCRMTGLKTLLPPRFDDLLFQVFTPEFKQPRSDYAVIMFSGRKELQTKLMQGRAPSSFAETHRTPECRFHPGHTAEPLPAAVQAGEAYRSARKLDPALAN
mmetsp:Transcript_70416/g.115871  ORF Transcript_70416/g.115871 Transcript_70416/m.115871 type:complete len:116 (+) Transcript_70416:32-379(+)